MGGLKGHPMTQMDDTLPQISWREMEVILQGMATSDTKRRMVHHLIEGTRKQAAFLTAGGVVTELAYITAAMLDASFCPTTLESGVSEVSLSSSASPPQPRGS